MQHLKGQCADIFISRLWCLEQIESMQHLKGQCADIFILRLWCLEQIESKKHLKGQCDDIFYPHVFMKQLIIISIKKYFRKLLRFLSNLNPGGVSSVASMIPSSLIEIPSTFWTVLKKSSGVSEWIVIAQKND